MTITKNKLEVLFLTLKGTEGVLSLAESRIRDQFMKGLLEAVKTFEAERKAIYEKFCTKDEDGNILIENDRYSFDNSVVAELNDELEVLYAEQVDLPVVSREALKAILERTEYKPKTGEVALIDEIIESL